MKFENDGTSSTTLKVRVRVQSQAGVKEFGVLTFPYASATTTLEIDHVRVIKPDGRIIETPAENALDMPTEVTREAPFYSDLKELQVAVKGLEVGDTLDFAWHAETNKALDPGEFWEDFDFFRNAIVLEEVIELRVPRDRQVQVKSAKVQPVVSDDGSYRLYRWTNANLSRKSEKDEESADSDSDEPPRPDVQVSTFQSWDEVDQWVRTLFAPRAAPTPEIQAKAAELTRGAKTDTEKMQAIYAYVSAKFRYIGVAFGIGRMQPHAAADILTNDYGDCKDKHTLMASLLQAAGITAYPALINSQAKIDPDVPSPGQFDHVITAIPQGKDFLFLDSTPEVAPFNMLVQTLRDKETLVVPDSGAVQLVDTPADPPFPSYINFEANGTLDSTGTYDGKVQMSIRGDAEVFYRAILRQAGQADWKDVMQKISQNLGFGGTVSDVTATPIEETDKVFDITYSYNREKYGDWDNRRITPPLPPLGLPEPPGEKEKHIKPLKLGSPAMLDYKATMRLPAGSSPELPPQLHIEQDFAEYTATYSFSDGVLHAERRLESKARKVTPAQMDAYRTFVKRIEDNAGTWIPLSGGSGISLSEDVSGTAEARDLYEQGRQAWQQRDMAAAEDDMQRAVEKDPKYVQAWVGLATLHAFRDPDKAIDEFKKAIALQPSWITSYQPLTILLMNQHRADEAIAVWRGLEEATPENPEAPERIGAILMTQKRYADAASEFEMAARLKPEKSVYAVETGEAYARAGNKEKALAAFDKVLNDNPSADDLNNVGYVLTDTNMQLDDGLKYAERAVKMEEGETMEIDLQNVDTKALSTVPHLAAYWDTLGWAHFRLGHLDQAEKYVNAGWLLSQKPVIGDHLGQIYEKEGKRDLAIKAYAYTLATKRPPDETKARLDALHPRESATGWGAVELQNMRIIDVQVSPKPKKHVSADFVMLVVPGPKIALIRFLNGADGFPGAEEAVRNAKFDMALPDDGPVQILRRGVIDCEPEIPQCNIALTPPDDLRPVN